MSWVFFSTDTGTKEEVCPDVIVLDQCKALEKNAHTCTIKCKAKHPGKYIEAYCQTDITCICVYDCTL